MITASDLTPNSAAPQWLARPTRSLRFVINTIFKTKIIISYHLDVILNSNTCHHNNQHPLSTLVSHFFPSDFSSTSKVITVLRKFPVDFALL